MCAFDRQSEIQRRSHSARSSSATVLTETDTRYSRVMVVKQLDRSARLSFLNPDEVYECDPIKPVQGTCVS